MKGRCHCGSVKYEVTGEAITHALCHCSDCRRCAGAPMVGWAMFPENCVKVIGETKIYKSSQHARREFCPQCGTGLFYRNAEILPGITNRSNLKNSIVILDEVKKGLREVIKNFKGLPVTLQKEILRQVVQRVEVTPKEIRLVLFGSQPDPQNLKTTGFTVLTTGSYGGRNGSGGGTRTPDQAVNSRLLYQLSYA